MDKFDIDMDRFDVDMDKFESNYTGASADGKVHRALRSRAKPYGGLR